MHSPTDGPAPDARWRRPSCDWRSLAQEHATAVAEENRAYLAMTAATGTSAVIPGIELDLDPALLANWERARQAVTRAWERLHRYAVSGGIRF